MASAAFGPGDFKVFDVKGFQPRMGEIRTRIRPKLETLGRSLAPALARSLIGDTFAHVAKHARRTVNPPDDTWVAFGPDARGYKKHCHFKVAVSRQCVRFVFEIGPEHAEKKRWAAAWKKNAGKLSPVLRRIAGLTVTSTSCPSRLRNSIRRPTDTDTGLQRISAETCACVVPSSFAASFCVTPRFFSSR